MPRGKAFLLGNGRVGKTQLARRLLNKGYNSAVSSTHGVQLHCCPLEAEKDSPHTYPTHSICGTLAAKTSITARMRYSFTGRRSFCCSGRRNSKQVNSKKPGWSSAIARSPTGSTTSGCSAALAGTTGESSSIVPYCSSRVSARARAMSVTRLTSLIGANFPHLYQLTFSARTGRGLSGLSESLQEAVTDLFGRRQQPLMGVGRVAVREKLRAMHAESEPTRASA